MQPVGIFCGSSVGCTPAYMEAAYYVNRCLAEQRINIVYGGWRVGLMGGVGDSALAHGGHVTSVVQK